MELAESMKERDVEKRKAIELLEKNTKLERDLSTMSANQQHGKCLDVIEKTKLDYLALTERVDAFEGVLERKNCELKNEITSKQRLDSFENSLNFQQLNSVLFYVLKIVLLLVFFDVFFSYLFE